MDNPRVLGEIGLPVKTFFYKRKDGSIFACSLKEADKIHDKYEQVGVSDGTTYYKMMLDEKVRTDEIIANTNEDDMRKVLRQLTKEAQVVVRKAFNAELEVATGNKERPQDGNIRVYGGGNGVMGRIHNLIG